LFGGNPRWEENTDRTSNEHYNRSPDCPFFALTEEYQGPTKRGRKGARASKISRLSGQSVATVSEAASDLAADHEDSVMTTTSVATTASKRGRTKKATAAKGRRTRAKKDEVVESIEQDEEVTMPPPPPQKNGRGRKRGSDAIEDSVLGSREAPAPKKRATRKAANEDASMMDASTDTVLAEEPPKKTKGRKGRGSQAKTRKVSTASIASTASTASLRPGADQIPDDNEIDRQLAADLERPLTDDEDITADSRSERQTSKTKKAAQGSAQGDWAMFDPVPPVVDDADVEAELKALEAEQAQSQTQEDLNVPKKGRKAGTRKASKQKKAERKPVEVEAQLEPKRAPAAPGLEQLEPKTMSAVMDSLDEDELLKASVTSTATVVKANSPVQVEDVAEPAFEPSIEPTLPLPSKSEPQPEPEPNETKANPVKRGRGRPKRTSSTSARGSTANAGAAQTNKVRDVEVEAVSGGKSFVPESAAWPRREAAKSAAVAIPAEPSAGASVETISKPRCPAPALTVASPGSRSLVRPLPHPPSTPGRHVSPAASARQAALSPSQTPQSSDAENQPPSSKPPSSTAKRVALAPVEATPRTQSPSKRNRIAGLQTIMPWTAVDLDLIFESANSDKENGMRRQLSRGGDLTSPEKRMTVEEWIYYNAGRAEQRLKHECETVVNKFENEGSRAMRVLEGLIVE